MATSNLAQVLNFEAIRNRTPDHYSRNDIKRIYERAKYKIDRHGLNPEQAIIRSLSENIGRKITSRKNEKVSRNSEPRSLFSDHIHSEKVTRKIPNTYPTSKASGISGKLTRNSEQPLLFPDNLLGPIPSKKLEKKPTTQVEKFEPKKEKFNFFTTVLPFVRKITFGWIDIFLNLISNPALLMHGIFIAAFTGLLVYLQKDFYVQAEGKAELVAYSIAIMCELALIIMVFIKSKGWLKALKNLTLGILFIYVGCCLGFSVWQKATEQRVEINSNIFSESESLRLKKSVALAESARTKVSSRDGATAMENARKNVQQAQARLDEYLKTNKKIPKTLRVNQEFNVIFQAVLLILLRLIFMGVNAVLSHSARSVWDGRALKLA